MKLLATLFAASVALVPAAAAENVYRNGPADQATSSIFLFPIVSGGVSQEWGDQVTLISAGTITEMTVYTVGDFNPPTGAERIRIRYYLPDGPAVGNPPLASPGTEIWDSGPLPLKPGWRAHRIDVPAVAVPDTFIWTATFEGVSGLPFDRAGLCYFGPPTKGTSDETVWRRVDSGQPWNYFSSTWTNGSTAYGSFGAVLWAEGNPGPVIFDSTQSPDRAFRYAPTAEFGDDAVFEGIDRFVSEVSIEYVSEVTVPQGDEHARVRIYDRDDTVAGGPPLNVLYDSGLQPIDASTGGHILTVYPEMTLPDDVIWTIEFAGVSQIAGDKISVVARTDPNPGGSVPLIWSRDSFGLSEYWLGDPTYDPGTWPSTAKGYNNIIANFSARFGTNIPPTIVENTDPPTVQPGTVFAGTSLDLLASDDQRWVLRPGVVLSTSLPPIVVQFTHFLPSSTATSLRMTIESRASANLIHQQLQIWNFTTNLWVTVDLVPRLPYASLPDLVRTVDFGDPTPYIGPSNEVRVRARFRANGPVLSYPYSVSLDREYLTFRP